MALTEKLNGKLGPQDFSRKESKGLLKINQTIEESEIDVIEKESKIMSSEIKMSVGDFDT